MSSGTPRGAMVLRASIRAALLAAALALGACGSSSGKPAAAGSTTTNVTPTTSVAVVPSPFQLHQRFGAGKRWELTAVAATRGGSTFTVTLDVLNDGPGAAQFAAATPGLFTMLDAFPTQATPNPPRHSPSGTLVALQVPANQTRRLVVRFLGIPSTAKHPVLWFHGHLLPGTIDASVWFNGV